MKKIYFLLSLFTFLIGNAQTSLSEYLQCDTDIDGFTQYDLRAKEPEMMFVLNAAQYSIAYYHSLVDAQTANNPILNPSNYTNATNPEQVFASATNIQTLERFYFEFLLYTTPQPFVLNPAVLTFCSTTELPIYNLNDARTQLTNDPLNVSFTYYEHESGNIISEPTFFVPSILPVQVIDVVMSNDCGTVQSTITLHTNDCSTTCPTPVALSVNSIAETSAVATWVGTGMTSQIYLVPIGTPAPTPSTTPTGWTASSSSSVLLDSLIPNTCYAIYVRLACSGGITSGWAGPYHFCTHGNCEINGECPDNLSLVAFLDSNTNGIKDSGEVSFPSGSFAYDINNSGNIQNGYTNVNYGFRIFDQNPANAYNLSFTVNPELLAFYSSTATYSNIHVTAGSGTQTFYFPITPLAPFKDLEVYMVFYGMPRPGFTYTNLIYFRNNGFENIPSGTITFIKDANVSINSITPAGALDTANGFTFDFTNLASHEQRFIQVNIQVPTIPTVTLGQVLTNSVSIIPVIDDSVPANNYFSLSQNIVGSYDPNDKIESHGGKIALDTFTENDFLTYTIQFENTGTASAEFIRVEDLLDASLNPESVEMLNASHPYNMRKIGNKLIWNFYEVNLPPTSTNPTQSHGFIQFKIKPTAGYATGTMIPNAADIYFDYNPPIVTDTFHTEFVETLATTSFDTNEFYMYPNPAKTFVNLGLQDAAESIANVTIYDVLGKSVKTVNGIQSNETTVDVSRFSKGIYFVEITTESNLKVTKKLIIN
ncbi:T9SS type A sorting domain-containing protein [Flavobacterium sp.]|uniref:T9SS type A sorting domain-containing protein n=1 Tax=Flavobacterium sp. TaxID=239 RepID=UPI00286C6BA2|nr:T9SS type A sorting domain-containing protein [Flavobacterium sp.]